MIVNFFRNAALVCSALVLALEHTPADAVQPLSHHATRAGTELENAALHFQITERRFRSFRQVARLRRLARAEILPGFPENPCLDCGIAELRRDRPSVRLLARAHLMPRDYVLTGWALVVARAPGDWGLDERQLPAATQRNVAFVRAHLAEVDSVLNSE